MPLKINLKSDQKIILNGAVIKNSMPHTITFTLLNDSRILQDKDVLSYEDATTPASRVYYSLQCAYLFDNQRESHLENFKTFLLEYVSAAPSAQELADQLLEKIEEDELFKALKLARDLISHEGKVLEHVQQSDSELPNSTE